jgi:hypothetical protein
MHNSQCKIYIYSVGLNIFLLQMLERLGTFFTQKLEDTTLWSDLLELHLHVFFFV